MRLFFHSFLEVVKRPGVCKNLSMYRAKIWQKTCGNEMTPTDMTQAETRVSITTIHPFKGFHFWELNVIMQEGREQGTTLRGCP